MQPPTRPWENGTLNRFPPHINTSSPRYFMPSNSSLLHSSSPATHVQSAAALPQAAVNSNQPPPLPRRKPSIANQTHATGLRSHIPLSGAPYSTLGGGYGSYGGYGGYNNYGGYGGFGSYGLGGYGGYNSYLGYGMSGYGAPNSNDPENRFIQLAEESSRPAFQSIQSLVQAFHSVSMMLDSTFNAVYTSFRAVLGVAENFGRLRSLLGQFFSSVALFRAFIWLYKKVLFVLGLRRENPSQDQLWQAAVQEVGEDLATATGRPRSSWPILMFMGIVFSGPYLIFKLMSSLSSTDDKSEIVPRNLSWDPVQVPGTPAVAIHGFLARSDDELSFIQGQRIFIAPVAFQPKDSRGWLLARAEGNPQVGLVPYNYLAAPSQTAVAPRDNLTNASSHVSEPSAATSGSEPLETCPAEAAEQITGVSTKESSQK